MDKICRKCSKPKPIKDFNADSRRSDGLYPWCYTCRSAYNKKYKGQRKQALDEHSKRYSEQSKNVQTLKKEFQVGNFIQSIFTRYGISAGDLLKMLRQQSGRCAICGDIFDGSRAKTFNVDHCHRTGKIRGLLCNSCNMGLGGFTDDIPKLWAAMRYLKTPPSYGLIHKRSVRQRPRREKNKYPDSTEYLRRALLKISCGGAES